ncbi:hypothetical protein [Mycoavidus sp. B2-EB]|uniref:hypothetical protein n=1 Tax=Mycoavidus sp. B2-EB TaxID=2651972 RepID=UPI001627FEA4|nr:hypothetical protein [Mycoavidus sp. B2-EB]BBO60455.1 hypothetical protein MPB2EB_1596 [Mycoavidus sp. B2-EB]
MFMLTNAGFLYPAIALGVWGWAIGESLVTEYMLDALSVALEHCQPPNVIYHNDQRCHTNYSIVENLSAI